MLSLFRQNGQFVEEADKKNFHFFALFFQTFLKIMITASLTCYFGSLLKAHLDIEVKGLDCLSRSLCVFSMPG